MLNHANTCVVSSGGRMSPSATATSAPDLLPLTMSTSLPSGRKRRIDSAMISALDSSVPFSSAP